MDSCFEVLTLLTVVVLDPPMPEAIEDNPIVSSSDDLLASFTFASEPRLPTLTLE